MRFEDIVYSTSDRIATIRIDRPESLNAFRRQTVDELIAAFEEAGDDPAIGAVILTGTGERAFCVGGDVKDFGPGGYRGASWTGIGLRVELLHRVIRAAPKPVIAAINGYAIGGGNVLQVVCDLSIAAERATFGQVGPRYGSFDAGYGTAYLARLVGERKAREIWFLCRRYTAREALEMGLINAVVPDAELQIAARAWATEALGLSPTALKMIKASFNADTEHVAGIGQLAFGALGLYYGTAEASEGHVALAEKRAPRYPEFRRTPE
ncbi:MAG: enoyl-CoA hydratase/isomerase family protein [Candidatus Eremiobacteraeota bacterium]|nr:enoyl-CoA hydratase/isomerase family protein [Candidatus Eremiobacteraeota bacterium]